MPFFTTEDFNKLEQKLTVLEVKLHQLAVNIEVNMGYSDNSTLPVIPNSESQLNDSASKQNTENKPTGSPPACFRCKAKKSRKTTHWKISAIKQIRMARITEKCPRFPWEKETLTASCCQNN
ncbi:hypothetical protein ATANTOWER_030727 [Ataeniobius toweri]|uniref:Uncharacterized protein n=1 Tax=Ataeniobius toweri TaxID=208326 RepID=A0ABU7A8L2_9TELE|nr:hypothetical protein [Ataeniobius toweri]